MPSGNSFSTHDGTHVGGSVVMALDQEGKAFPVEADTPIGAVKVVGFSFEQLCRALAAHAVIVGGGDAGEMETAAAQIIAFAQGK